jgi:hypothetical protein
VDAEVRLYESDGGKGVVFVGRGTLEEPRLFEEIRGKSGGREEEEGGRVTGD